MPFRLIFTLLLVALVAVFTGFNLDNKCNVWLFHTFQDVPVCFTILISLLAGVFITLPFTLGKRMTKEEREAKRAEKKEKKNESKNSSVPAVTSVSSAPEQSSADAVPAHAETEHSSDLISGESPK